MFQPTGGQSEHPNQKEANLVAFQQKRKQAQKSTRITGLFQSKTKRGLYVGTARPEDIKALGAKMKEAMAADKGLVFFLWKNSDAEEGQPLFSLTADVAQDRDEKPGPGRKRQVTNDDGEPESDDDLPF